MPQYNEALFLNDKLLKDLYGPQGALVKVLSEIYPCYTTGAIHSFVQRAVDNKNSFMPMLYLAGQQFIEYIYKKMADGEEITFSPQIIYFFRFLIYSNSLCFDFDFHYPEQILFIRHIRQEQAYLENRHEEIKHMVRKYLTKAKPGFWSIVFDTKNQVTSLTTQMAIQENHEKKRSNKIPLESTNLIKESLIEEEELLILEKARTKFSISSLMKDLSKLKQDKNNVIEELKAAKKANQFIQDPSPEMIIEIPSLKQRKKDFTEALVTSEAKQTIKAEASEVQKISLTINRDIKKFKGEKTQKLQTIQDMESTLDAANSKLKQQENAHFQIHYQMSILSTYFMSKMTMNVLRKMCLDKNWDKNKPATLLINSFFQFLKNLAGTQSDNRCQTDAFAIILDFAEVLANMSEKEDNVFFQDTLPLLHEQPVLIQNLSTLFKIGQDHLSMLKNRLEKIIENQENFVDSKKQSSELVYLISSTNQLLQKLVAKPDVLKNTATIEKINKLHITERQTLENIVFALGVPLVELLVCTAEQLDIISHRASNLTTSDASQKKRDGSALPYLFNGVMDKASIDLLSNNILADRQNAADPSLTTLQNPKEKKQNKSEIRKPLRLNVPSNALKLETSLDTSILSSPPEGKNTPRFVQSLDLKDHRKDDLQDSLLIQRNNIGPNKNDGFFEKPRNEPDVLPLMVNKRPSDESQPHQQGQPKKRKSSNEELGTTGKKLGGFKDSGTDLNHPASKITP
ncbi:MAG: hypothetical protein H2069_09460 [Legionella sp.]|nr:hypothetical protein [Legionella sp.]